ncbi:hypothetical protein KBZ14_06100 [Synechococcus sp. HJ21-Hayes]|uniref:hypothetical protein n=1 Tax=unclassified Synechococcus TaxID=2626047 RepID=UPI0020CD5B8F|nr:MULTISPECIES: hypothetical protein [unclassified Synechococcus]MCP9831879.1 hypothetical protein [Synechococcus sp. JJ3a-Johnson]MCP9852442.1 hypothetical protein [Synechococcus sp. HJ21-Hayes]
MTGKQATGSDAVASQAARTIALQMLEERGRGAVLVGVARVDAALEHLLQAVMNPATAKGDGLFLPERPLGSIGAKVALASRLGLIDGPVERALNVLRKLRNALAHSAESASLGDAAHSSRLAEVYEDARTNPLWTPLEMVLAAQPPSANGVLEPALRDYILLITILVAFLEATAQQLRPMQPPVVMGFSGVSRNNGAIQE